jgi:hypothetical protein
MKDSILHASSNICQCSSEVIRDMYELIYMNQCWSNLLDHVIRENISCQHTSIRDHFLINHEDLLWCCRL